MLRKLIHYELRATGRLFLPFYGVLLLLALINKFFFSFETPVPDLTAAIAASIYVVAIVAVMALTYIVMIHRFYKNLLCDEGYLMFTLPLRPWQLVIGKLLAAVVWMALSTAVALFILLLMSLRSPLYEPLGAFYRQFIRDVLPMFGNSRPSALLNLLLSYLIGNVATILMIYTSVSIGQLFGRSRILASFGAFLGINFAVQGGSSLLLFLLTPGFSGQIGKLNDLAAKSGVIPPELNVLMQRLVAGGNLLNLLLCALFFGVTAFLLSKRLNLE